MARLTRTAPSRGVLAAMAVLAVVAIVGAMLSSRNGVVSSPLPTPSQATPTVAGGSSDERSPSATRPMTPAPTDAPADLARWAAIAPATPGPEARSGHTWTIDPSSAVAYLFGGRGSAGVLGDVWAYDTTADRWVALRPAGERPTPRFEHAAAWVDGLGLVVLGGRANDIALDDLWAFDPNANAWRAIDVSDAKPSARSAACLAVRADGRFWLFGGEGSAGAELWVFDPGSSSWTQRAVRGGPSGRSGAACWWTSDDRLVIHGGRMPGQPSVPLGDVWVFDPDAGGTWQEAADVAPRDRGASTTTNRGGVVAGGIGAGDELLADVAVFDDRSLAATVLGPARDGPAARSGAALADDPEGERTLMFGGLGADGPLSDLWALDLP